jgi:hypothetical protein
LTVTFFSIMKLNYNSIDDVFNKRHAKFDILFLSAFVS